MKIELIETAKKLIAVPWCFPALKDACSKWIDAIDTDGEAEAAKEMILELEEDVCGIDDTISFFSTPAAIEHFGEERANSTLKSLIESKANGGKYCNCDACTLGAVLLEAKDEILA